jgi:hypothetical protein
MPVSGLILRLSEGPAGAAGFAALQSCPELTLGERAGCWLPAALSARDVAHSREVHDRLTTLPGVEFVDVVYVNFEEES